MGLRVPHCVSASPRESETQVDIPPTYVYIVSIMPAPAPLGEFEVVVLMAVLHLDGNAYGSTIRAEIERRSGRRISRGSVYITLDRLEDKGLLASKLERASVASRGGRQKRLFRVTPPGLKLVRHSVSLLARMQEGLEPLLGEP